MPLNTKHFVIAFIILWLCSNPAVSKDHASWDVNNPPGPPIIASIDTKTGTWISVDVSPDGRTIAFDLLGDIYLLPITGGTAKPITRGMAWDMQPRFSPDGKSIAYMSDQSGGDNIWTMDLNGTQQKQITDENYRLLNNPAWSPDGQFIAARKHFTSRRSLGAGEIWLYHASGGTQGLQLNERPNEEKDLGEPAFSPDGRYVYFSRDSTPGTHFEYSKDSNKQIYEIFSIDRNNGEIETVISGPGGAVRPTPSPDGKYLAFVRRKHNQSSIFLKDLNTDAIFPIYEKLDRDMQETWAIHGVYPAMAWTPNSKEIVFWAQGKLWRINIKSKNAIEIPFHIKGTREMRKALRFQFDAAAEQTQSKMLRWANVSPDGKQLVYQALGHLYIQDLPNGKAKRLTQQQNHFEFFPSFSADGNWVVYTSWNDQALGHIRKVSSRGGKDQIVTQAPGHYQSPRFSPDGSLIVYQKTRGGRYTSPLYTSKPGIYTVPSAGGEPIQITDNGSDAFFNQSSKRIFITRYEGSGEKLQTKLISLDLHGTNLQEHISTDFATEFTISPDQNWLAFVESYQVYIAPFTTASKAIQLGPKATNLPLKKVTDIAGSYIHWSGDSQTLYWSNGATLYEKPLKSTFAFANGADHNSINENTRTYNIGFKFKTDQPSGLIAFTNARIVTMQGDQVIENGTVLINQNRITKVGKSNSIDIPSNAHIIDASGKTIIPGLIDAHWHGGHWSQVVTPQQHWNYYAALALGVTTIHDPSADTGFVFSASELQKAGMIVAPRIFSTGTILYGARDFYTAEVDSLEQAKTHLQRMQAAGAFSVKSYNQPRRDQRQQILAAARELNMLVVPEGGSLFQHNMTMIVDGHSSIEHAIPVAAIYDDVKQLWSQSKTTYTPTLVIAFGGMAGEYYWYQHTDVWKHPILSKYVPETILRPRSIRRPMAPDSEYNHFNAARVATQLSKLGVETHIGGHGQREGLAAHWEMWMYAQGGMTPLQVIRTATLNGAKLLGMEKDLGSIEAGKLADLVILNSNPLDDIYSSDKVDMVMINGRLYDVSTMHEIGNHRKKRKPFFFE